LGQCVWFGSPTKFAEFLEIKSNLIIA